MDNEKSDWIKSKLEEIFDVKLNHFEKSYLIFKKTKNDIKGDFCQINENCKDSI